VNGLVKRGDDWDSVDSMMMSTFSIVILGVVMAVAVTSALGQLMQRYTYYGATDYRDLEADGTLKWTYLVDDPPHMPWVTAHLFNKGPGLALVSINSPDGFTPLNKGDSLEANFSGADRRIEVIYYRCNPGEHASVRAEGKY